jgi:hypothetical protein
LWQYGALCDQHERRAKQQAQDDRAPPPQEQDWSDLRDRLRKMNLPGTNV